VLAAFAATAELDLLLERSGLPGADWDHLRTRAKLDAALAGVRERGFEAITPDGHELAAFAVPVRDGRDQVMGALGCYAPSFRCGPERRTAIVAAMRLTAQAIAREI
jgi:DNA-binding IclR family transcriptional regulator